MDLNPLTNINSFVSIPGGFVPDKGKFCVRVLDQSLLPHNKKEIEITSLKDGIEAILKLRVRGAPSIAQFAVFILTIEMRNILKQNYHEPIKDSSFLKASFYQTSNKLLQTRPTAVNLRNSLNRMKTCAENFFIKNIQFDPSDFIDAMWYCAQNLLDEDRELCIRIGKNASELILPGFRVLTHCNTGALATAGIGTAIGGFYTAHLRSIQNSEKPILVYVSETRPLLQGARLTAWELREAGLDIRLITDSMAAHFMQRNKIDMVMLGADRITSRGDVANKIGTLSLAVLCNFFKIPFYVVAPSTTIDSDLGDGMDIEIEMRDENEVCSVLGHAITAKNVPALNPAFDVTPAELITAIITENGVFQGPYCF